MDKERLLELAGIQQLNENDQLVDEVAEYIVQDLRDSIDDVSQEAIDGEIDQFVHHLRQRVKHFAKNA